MKARVFFYRGYLQGLFIVLLITYVWAYLTYLHSQPPGNSTAYLQALPRSPNLTRQHFMRHAALRLVLLSILLAFITQAIVTPVMAEAKSYRPFMEEVNQRVKPGDKLYLYGDRIYNACVS